jgi:hypothetical protein
MRISKLTVDANTKIFFLGLLFILFVVFISGCTSSLPPPTQQIAAAEEALSNAEQARVAEHSLPELQEARSKLSNARAAVQNNEMLLAKRMAEQASIDIKLASAKAELAKAEIVNTDMERGIDVLKQEMQRNTGGLQ